MLVRAERKDSIICLSRKKQGDLIFLVSLSLGYNEMACEFPRGVEIHALASHDFVHE